MPGATGTYNVWGPYARDIIRGLISPEDSGRYNLILITSAFTPNLDNDQRYSDVTGELYGGTWPQGGVTLDGVGVVLDTASNRISLVHDDVLSNEVTLASPGASRVIIVDKTGATSADERLAFTALLDAIILPVAGPVAISSPNGIVRSSY